MGGRPSHAAREQPASRPEATERRAEQRADDDPEILLLDDDPGLLTLLDRVLSAAGHRCRTVTTPAEALAAAERYETIKVVISDIYMPAMDGLQFVDALHAKRVQRPPPRVLLLTAHPSVRLAVGALRLGVSDFLTKPVRPPELVEAVARALRRAREDSGPADNAGVAELAQQAERLAQALKSLTAPTERPRGPAAGPVLEMAPESLSVLDIVEIVRRLQTRAASDELDDIAWDLLLELARAEYQGQTRAVSDLMITSSTVSSTTLLRRINRLVACGYVAKRPDPADGRREFVSLTPKGHDLITAFLEQAKRQIGELMAACA